MNSEGSSTADKRSPLPAGQLRWFVMFFHVVFVGGLVLCFVWHLRRENWTFGGEQVLLLGLVSAQIALYIRLFAIPCHAGAWPKPPWLAFYFAASIAIFYIECRVDPVFQWAVGAYMGQLLALPWRIALPATAALFAGFFLIAIGRGRLAELSGLEWIGALGSLATWTVLAMFLHRALITSSERGRLILELEAARQELESARQRDAELAALRERERLARDLHDSLGHSLVTLTVQLEALRRLLVRDPGRAEAMVAEMQTLTRASMEDLRRSLANLRAPGLVDRPLPEALQTLCAEGSKRFGTEVKCHIGASASSLPPRVAEALWRVAQEAVTNIEKHAHARNAEVSLRFIPGAVRLEVSDDGVGLPPGAEQKPGHYGLKGSRERIEGLGGTFTLVSNGKGGTRIDAQVPLITDY